MARHCKIHDMEAVRRPSAGPEPAAAPRHRDADHSRIATGHANGMFRNENQNQRPASLTQSAENQKTMRVNPGYRKPALHFRTIVLLPFPATSACNQEDGKTKADELKELETRVRLIESRVEVLLDQSTKDGVKWDMESGGQCSRDTRAQV